MARLAKAKQDDQDATPQCLGCQLLRAELERLRAMLAKPVPKRDRAAYQRAYRTT